MTAQPDVGGGPLLSAKNLSVRFGGVLAVNNVSFDVQRGEVFTLIGPNGAGKTTVFNLISRIYQPTTGSITFEGKTLSFALSAALAGIGGALYAHAIRFLSPDQFNIIQSIDLLLMVVIGGLGSIHGAFLGAIFLIGLPQAIGAVKDYLPATIGQAPGLKAVVYGMVLIGFVMFEPLGLYGRWLKVRTYLQLFPFYRKGLFKRQKSFQKSDRLK